MADIVTDYLIVGAGAMLSANPKTESFNARSRLHPTGPEIARLKATRSPRLAALAPVAEVIRANLPGVLKLGMAAKALHEAGMKSAGNRA